MELLLRQGKDNMILLNKREFQNVLSGILPIIDVLG